MRTLLIISLVLMSLLSSLSWGLSMDDLVKREGIYYKMFTDVPFTGMVEGMWNGSLKNGKREGEWVIYHDNGQLFMKGNYKNGKTEGTWVYHMSNGQLRQKINYRNGKEEGPWVTYHDDGQLSNKGNYKNGLRDGPWVFFNEDGTKRVSENKYGNLILDEGSGLYRDGKKVSD